MGKFLNWLKKYWLEILVFGVIFGILIIDLNPSYTFINKGLDSIEYIYCAKYLYVSHQMSPPLFLILGHFFLMLPIATEAWRFGLLSVFATMGTCWFIYLVINRLTLNKVRNIGLLGVLIYGLSALVISQSTIVQTYSLITMFSVGAFYFAIAKRWKLMGLMLGLGIATHPLMGAIFIIMLIGYKEYRKNWKALLITLSFGLFYLYIPLRANITPDLYLRNGTSNLLLAISNEINVILSLTGTLSILDFPKRLLDTIGVVVLSVGVLMIIPIIMYFKQNGYYKNVIFWLCIIPIAIFATDLDAQTYDYMLLAMPFLAIVACISLNSMIKNNKIKKWFVVTSVIVLLGIGTYNVNYFDIGRTLDPNMAIAQTYSELAEIPNGSIFISSNFMAQKYNVDNDRHINEIDISKLDRIDYRNQLITEGIKLEYNANTRVIARSIIALNNNVWIEILNDPSVYGYSIVQANHNVDLLPIVDNSIIKITGWSQVLPDNPYDIITSKLYINYWRSVIISYLNIRLIIIIIVPMVYIIKSLFKKKVSKDDKWD
jgi:hypothetical protein